MKFISWNLFVSSEENVLNIKGRKGMEFKELKEHWQRIWSKKYLTQRHFELLEMKIGPYSSGNYWRRTVREDISKIEYLAKFDI